MIPALLERIAATNSSTEKKKILAEHSDSRILKELFTFAYDPFLTFGVSKFDMDDLSHTSETPDDWFKRAFDLLTLLCIRQLKGNAAKSALRELASQCDKSHAQLLNNVLKRDLRMGAGVRLINSVFKDLLPEDFCMAANKYDAKRIEYPVYADLKLDGVRCIAAFDETAVKLLSRNAKEFKNYGHIERELAQLGVLAGCKLDGEITCGHFQDLMRTVSRKTDGIELASDAVYNIFDYVAPGYTLVERLAKLDVLCKIIEDNGLKSIRVLRGVRVNNESELLRYYESALERGYEGIMVKSLGSPYEFKRGWSWQKMKPEHTDDLEIVGFEEGNGKYEGQLGVIVCRLPNGDTVRVGSGFKDEERAALWQKRDDLVGQIAEVKYQEKTRDGSLRFPIFIRFRPDKTL